MKQIWADTKDRLFWLLRQMRLRLLFRVNRWVVIAGGALLMILVVGLLATWDDIMQTQLDPRTPYQTYVPPKGPDYAKASSWALNPVGQIVRQIPGPVDIFFIHPTTFKGGRNWNGPIEDRGAARKLERVMLPNYAGPFARVGRVFAPRYRQASLYAYQMALRDDARDARRTYPYDDVLEAFRYYMANYNFSRPFIIVGVEQGGQIADRLLREEVDRNPGLVAKLAAVYLIDVPTPAADYGPGAPVPPCTRRDEAHCLVAWTAVDESDPVGARRMLSRALVWAPDWTLADLNGRPVLCVNPILGEVSEAEGSAKQNLGAANASELEWGARAAFLPRQVSAQCVDGVLRVSSPRSASLKPSALWPDKFMERPYNPFFADLEADALKRVATYYGRAEAPPGAPPIEQSVPVDSSPVHKVDED